MKLNDLKFVKIQNYDPFNKDSNEVGMVTEWIAKNKWGNAVAFGRTKKECMEDARMYVARENRKG